MSTSWCHQDHPKSLGFTVWKPECLKKIVPVHQVDSCDIPQDGLKNIKLQSQSSLLFYKTQNVMKSYIVDQKMQNY